MLRAPCERRRRTRTSRREAWHQDYRRLAFHMPTEPARVFEIVRDGHGRLAGRRSITVDAPGTADPGLVSPRDPL